MKNLRRLILVLGPWRAWYGMAGLLLIATSFIRMLEPKILQLAVDGVVLAYRDGGTPLDPGAVARFFYRFLPDPAMTGPGRMLLGLGLIFLVIATLRGLTQFTASSLVASATERAIERLRNRLFGRILALPMTFHGKVPTGEMVQRSTGDVDTVRRLLINDVVEVIRLTAVFVGALLMMLSVHVTYALIAIGFVPLIAVTSAVFFRRERKVWDAHEEEQDKLTSIIQENLSGIRVVKAFAREGEEIARFTAQNVSKRALGLKQVALHTAFWPFSDLLVNLQISLSLLAGGYFALNGAITLGEFVSFSTYSMMVTWPLRHVGQIASRMGMAVVAMERMSVILEGEPEDGGGKLKPDGALRGEIEFRDVHFAYPSKPDQSVLRGVSFRIPAGQLVALIGPTGSGKSTAMQLLLRFYEPDKGAITLDGIDLAEYDRDWLRSRIGMVMQQPFLFSSTIRGNIAYAEPEAREEAVSLAAADAQIAHLSDRFPQGFETVVGEKGVTLSGGQKQRVALARTLLPDTDVLVLDDTTSAVDTETEFAIQDALSRRRHRRTTIAIAHRLTTVQAAERVLVIEQGRIVQDGSPADLMKREGYFRRIIELQSALEAEIDQL